jgi:hypothetical protein
LAWTHAETKKVLQAAPFFNVSLDEASKHGRSYLCIHAYVLQDWERVPLFLKVRFA